MEVNPDIEGVDDDNATEKEEHVLTNDTNDNEQTAAVKQEENNEVKLDIEDNVLAPAVP